MIGSIIGAGIGLAGSILGRKQQNEDQREMMELQAKLNQQQALYNQGLAKDMWNYTSFPNQVRKMKETGLSPALMYGMGGQGGSSSGAGQASGVGLSDAKGMQTGTAIQGMGLELANLASQIELNKSQAEKNKAEAEKTAGVDTQVQQATMDNLITQTANEKVKKGLIYADTRFKDALEEVTRAKVDEVGWNVKNLMKSLELTDRNIQATDLDNELKERTMEANVKQANETLKNTMADTLVKYSQGKLNEAEAKAITEKVKQGWSDIAIEMATKEQGWQQLEQNAEKIMNDLKLGEKGLDIQQQNVIKDYILGLGQIATQILTTGMKLPGGGAIIKGFK